MPLQGRMAQPALELLAVLHFDNQGRPHPDGRRFGQLSKVVAKDWLRREGARLAACRFEFLEDDGACIVREASAAETKRKLIWC